MLHFSSLQRYLFWTQSLGPHQNPPKRQEIVKHALLPASRPPAARLVTGERVPPRHHLLPASAPPAARLATTCCPPRDHLLPASTPASVYPRHHLLPASRPPAARLDTGERVLPAEGTEASGAVATLADAYNTHDSGTWRLWHMTAGSRRAGLRHARRDRAEPAKTPPGRGAVPPPRRRGNRGKRRSRNASRRLQHTRFWHMTALAHDGCAFSARHKTAAGRFDSGWRRGDRGKWRSRNAGRRPARHKTA